MRATSRESTLRLACRDLHALVTSTVRFYLWAAVVSAAVVAATTVFSWGHGRTAQVIIGVGALVAGAALALLLPLGLFLVIAPYGQRNSAWKDLDALVSASELEAAELRRALAARSSSDRIRGVAAMVGTELRDIRIKIERVKAMNPVVYPFGYQLPANRFAEYETILADDRGVYDVVSRAYTAAHHVNEMLVARESRRRPGNRQQLAAIPEDGLDEAHAAAGEALDKLGEDHNEPFRIAAQKAALGIIQDAVANRKTES
jgi:hypothetical protein